MHYFRSAVVALLMAPALPHLVEARGIKMISVSYGMPGVVCNATARVASLCNGQSQCSVDIMNTNLCGDPDFLLVKQASLVYKCGHTISKIDASEYTSASIGCN